MRTRARERVEHMYYIFLWNYRDYTRAIRLTSSVLSSYKKYGVNKKMQCNRARDLQMKWTLALSVCAHADICVRVN